jgi:Fe-S cluster assembly protein SufB
MTDYKYGFSSNIDSDAIPSGLSEDVIRIISAKNNEPQWLLDFRLKAYTHFLKQPIPTWSSLEIPNIDFQKIIYYSTPKKPPEVEQLTNLKQKWLNEIDQYMNKLQNNTITKP